MPRIIGRPVHTDPFASGRAATARVLLLGALLLPSVLQAADEDGFDSLLGLAASEAASAAGKQVESAQEAAVEAVKGEIESRVVWAIVRKKGMDAGVAAERAYDGLMQEVEFVNQQLELLDSAIDKYSKFATGQYSDLAVELWKEAVNKVAGSEAAKELFRQIGISSNVVGLAVRALEITADSYLELRKRTLDTRLESLYGAIEQDPRLFKGRRSGRELGTGNPVPVSREAVDILFDRISTESGFRERFKIYVEQELNATFPTPDFFDSMLIAFRTGGGAKAGAAVESETQRALEKNKDDIESWIRALLAQLNSHAKLREAAFVAERQLKEMQRARASLLIMRQRIAAMRGAAAGAIKNIPEMRAYIAGIPGRISAAEKSRDPAPLRAARAQIAEYVGRDLAAMPAGATRDNLVSAFRGSWTAVNRALRTIPDHIEAKIREDASKAAAAVPGPSRYAFSPVTITFNMKIDEVRGELDQAKDPQELQKALSAADQRIDKAYDDWQRAWRTASEAVSHYSNNESQSARIYSRLRQQLDRRQISTAQFDEEVAALGAALQRWQIPTNTAYQLSEFRRVELARQLSEVYGTRKAVFDNALRALHERNERLTAALTGLWAGGVPARLVQWDNSTYHHTAVAFRDAAALFDSLKGIGYAGLPRMAPPKWDAPRPEKLLQYLYTLRGNIGSETHAVNQAKLRYAVAEEVAALLKAGKPAADAIRGELALARQQAVALRTTEYELTYNNMEQSLTAYDRLSARAAAVNYRQAADQASAMDTELAYVNGLINQVDTIARLLDRYQLVEYRRGETTVRVPYMKSTDGSGGELLTTGQVAALPEQLNAAVAKVGFSGFDERAGVGLRSFIAGETARFRNAYVAPGYASAERQLFTKADLDALAGEIGKLAVTESNFNRNLYDILRSNAWARLDMRAGHETNSGVTKVDYGLLPKLAGHAEVLAAARTLSGAIGRKVADNKAHLEEQDRKQAEENKKIAECNAKRGIWAAGACNIMTVATGLPSAPGGGIAQPGGPGAGGVAGAGGAPGAARPPGAEAPGARPPGAGGVAATGGAPGAGDPRVGDAPSASRPPGAAGAARPSTPNAPSGPGMPVGAYTAAGSQPGAASAHQVPGSAAGAAGLQPGGSPQQSPGGAQPPVQAASILAPPAGVPQMQAAARLSQPAGMPAGGIQAMTQTPHGALAQAPSPQSSPMGVPPAMRPQQSAAIASGPVGGGSPASPGAPAAPFAPQGGQTSARPGQPPNMAAAGAMAPGAPSAAMGAAAADSTPQIREMYQRLAEAYQRKDLRGMTKYIAGNWQGAGGSSVADLESALSSSFRTFDTIQFQVQGLQIQKSGAVEYRVTYQTSLTAKIGKTNQQRQEKSAITDTVVVGADGPKITRTAGGSLAVK